MRLARDEKRKNIRNRDRLKSATLRHSDRGMNLRDSGPSRVSRSAVQLVAVIRRLVIALGYP